MKSLHLKTVISTLVVFGALFVGLLFLTSSAHAQVIPAGTVCTMDAMQCPDGSWVGRSGPNCQFVCPTNPTPAPTPACYALSSNLYFGLSDAFTGGQVSQLQTFLSAQNYFSGPIIGRFGPLTLRAVINFQSAYGIPSTGFVGPLTRAKIQALTCGTDPQPISKVTIYSITPTSGPVGTSVSITGFGFTNDNTIHFGYGAIVHVPISSSIAIACTTNPNCHGGINQTIQFTVPESLNPACYYSNPRCLIASQMTTPGSYNVSVENGNGTSGSVNFTVTSQGQGSPSVSSISPTSGQVGTHVTLFGSGFNANDTVLIGGGGVHNVNIVNSSQLAFTVPDSVGAYCPPGAMCPMFLRLLTPGVYQISVKDENTGVTSNSVAFTLTDSSGSQSISINGIDAPSTLALGQSGTWTVHATVGGGGTLHYSVNWGDQIIYPTMQASGATSVQTSATFTHAYEQSGTYTPTFTVTDDSGHSATVSSTVTVTPLY
jgi:hypothetical protein